MSRLLIAILCSVSYLSGASYSVGPAASSRFALIVEKTGLYRGKKHLFLFEKYDGRLDFDAAKPEASKIQLTIDSRSLICKDDWVSTGDLKKVQQTALDDMLAASRYPSMTFASSSIRSLGGDRYEVMGTLTLRDLVKPATVAAQLDATNPAALRLEGSATIRLSDYKLKPPSALLGAIGTKNEMTLNFTLIAAPTK